MTLVEFLKARLDDDHERGSGDAAYSNIDAVAEYGRRMVADVEAKRRVVHDLSTVTEWKWPSQADGSVPMEYVEALRYTLRLLALPYADHSDYDSSWRP